MLVLDFSIQTLLITFIYEIPSLKKMQWFEDIVGQISQIKYDFI